MESDENVSHNTSYDSAAQAAHTFANNDDDDELMNPATSQLYQVNEDDEQLFYDRKNQQILYSQESEYGEEDEDEMQESGYKQSTNSLKVHAVQQSESSMNNTQTNQLLMQILGSRNNQAKQGPVSDFSQKTVDEYQKIAKLAKLVTKSLQRDKKRQLLRIAIQKLDYHMMSSNYQALIQENEHLNNRILELERDVKQQRSRNFPKNDAYLQQENSENKTHEQDQTSRHNHKNSGSYSNSNQKNNNQVSSESANLSTQKLEFCTSMESELHRITQECKSLETKMLLDSFVTRFELEVHKIRIYCTDLEQVSERLIGKLKQTEKQELDNLELHLQMEAKMRALETFIKVSPIQSVKSSEPIGCQTELQFSELQRIECQIELQQKELQMTKQRHNDEHQKQQALLVRKSHELDIKERLIEEQRIEVNFKQKELNQRIKAQMTWPLNCLESEQQLLEKIRLNKSSSLPRLDDSNFLAFLQFDEQRNFLSSIPKELKNKAEQILLLEYTAVQERARTSIVFAQLDAELNQLQQDQQETQLGRQRYARAVDMERQAHEQELQLEKKRNELKQFQQGMFQVIEKFNHFLLDKKGDSQQHKNIPKFNPFAEVITAKTPDQLLAVIKQYRQNDPFTKFGAKPLEQIISQTLNLPDSQPDDSKIAEVKKILKRDAYFLQKERDWLCQERDRIHNTVQQAQLGHSPSYEIERQQQLLLSQNIAVEQEYVKELKKQLQDQREQARVQNERLIQQENDMNEIKLKMLIKFDQIKVLEDFYNNSKLIKPNQRIYLDLEVSDLELQNLVDKIYEKNQATRQTRINRLKKIQVWAKEGIESILRHLVFESCKHRSTKVRARYAFMMFKVVTFQVAGAPSLKVRQQLGHFGTQINGNNKGDWFTLYWVKQRQQLSVENFKFSNSEELLQIANQLESHIQLYWRFRAHTTISQLTLHLRRRLRMTAAFAFHKFRSQTTRMKSLQNYDYDIEQRNKNNDSQIEAMVSAQRNHNIVSVQSQPQLISYQSSNPKRQAAAVILLVLTNRKSDVTRTKARAFYCWSRFVTEQERATLQVELIRLHQDLQDVKHAQQNLKAVFNMQKTALKNKIQQLLH